MKILVKYVDEFDAVQPVTTAEGENIPCGDIKLAPALLDIYYPGWRAEHGLQYNRYGIGEVVCTKSYTMADEIEEAAQ